MPKHNEDEDEDHVEDAAPAEDEPAAALSRPRRQAKAASYAEEDEDDLQLYEAMNARIGDKRGPDGKPIKRIKKGRAPIVPGKKDVPKDCPQDIQFVAMTLKNGGDNYLCQIAAELKALRAAAPSVAAAHAPTAPIAAPPAAAPAAAPPAASAAAAAPPAASA